MFFLPTVASAQLELYGKLTETGSFEPVINYSGNKVITEKLSISFFGLIRKSWSQALIGLSYSPYKSITLSSGMGIEYGKNSPRYTASLFLKQKRTSLLILGELGSGEDNYLYKINLFHQLTEQLSLGGSAWRYHGLGPNFRLFIPELQSTIWAMPAYDLDAKQSRFMIGISLEFPK
ncbi:hypothetical protein IWX76_002835 [Pedobacter sp. CAN_A7]|uniref:hypothetical protein n=1 Tax=Pedobacter sp. CAN_A7 TaxID=2787722 RepID=UPI0018CAC3ED